jgi:ribosomal protein S18 acetylase RimI-like enzyme
MPEAGSGSVRVAEASISDVPSIHSFILAAWREAGPTAWGWTGATEASVQELASPERLSRLISNPNIKIFLAKDDQRIVGFAASRKQSETTVELSGMIVSERLTGKGIGTVLMTAALQAASVAGFADIIVKTETFNERAIGFYEANGFRKAAFSKEVVEGKSIDLVILRRGLHKQSQQG